MKRYHNELKSALDVIEDRLGGTVYRQGRVGPRKDCEIARWNPVQNRVIPGEGANEAERAVIVALWPPIE